MYIYIKIPARRLRCFAGFGNSSLLGPWQTPHLPCWGYLGPRRGCSISLRRQGALEWAARGSTLQPHSPPNMFTTLSVAYLFSFEGGGWGATDPPTCSQPSPWIRGPPQPILKCTCTCTRTLSCSRSLLNLPFHNPLRGYLGHRNQS